MRASEEPAIARLCPSSVKGLLKNSGNPACPHYEPGASLRTTMSAADSTPSPPMQLAWTTLGERADAAKLAQAAVEQGLAACVQIEGPIRSVYRWQGKLEEAQEFRLCFKLLPEHSAALEALVHRLHPYDIPEWVCVDTAHVSEKYLSWAQQPC